MDLVTRNAGTFLFLGGILVLIGYYVQYNVIREAHQEFLNSSKTYWKWFIVACLSAASYIILFILWISTDVLESGSDIFIAGLATFIFGAILWPWVFEDSYAEASAIWLTAIGSIIILIATTMSRDARTMALPFAAFLVLQHVFVDGIWWVMIANYSGGKIDKTKKIKHVVKALYQAYYAPLFVAVVLLLIDVWYRQTAVITVIAVTSMHFVVGFVVALSNSNFLATITNRYKKPKTVFADVNITFALVIALYLLAQQIDSDNGHQSKQDWLIFPAIVAALVGNTFCLADQLDVDVTLRSGWVSILILWVWLAILDETWGYTLSALFSGIIFLIGCIFLRLYFNGKTLISSHLVAGLFHALSSLALSIVVWAEKKSWRSPMTRYVTSWDHPTGTVNGDEVDCSEQPCYMRIDIKVLNEKLPLIDLVVAASCVSATYHLLIVYKQKKYEEEQKKIDATRKNYTDNLEKLQQQKLELFETELQNIEEIKKKISFFENLLKELKDKNMNEVYALRWKDYSLSASLLLVVIAALCGVSDIFLLVVPAIVVYILLDETPRLEKDWDSDSKPRGRFFSYIILYLLSWAPTIYQFYTSWEDDPKPPDAIVAIIFTLFAVYSGFIINFVEENENVKERKYIFLSFLAKTTLHWLLYTGISGRKDRVYATKEEAQLADDSGSNATEPVDLIVSIVVPVFIGSLGYYFTKEKNNDYKQKSNKSNVKYTSLSKSPLYNYI